MEDKKVTCINEKCVYSDKGKCECFLISSFGCRLRETAKSLPTVRFKVDERVGCIAVIDNLLITEDNHSNGLNADLAYVVAFWDGEYSKAEDCHIVPVRIKTLARKCCDMMNNNYRK